MFLLDVFSFFFIQVIDDNFSGVPVRIFRPIQNSEEAPKELPGLVFFHGVGLALMDTGQLVSDKNKFSVQSSESKK